MFVVSSGAVLRAEDVPEHFALREALLAEGDRFTSGGAVIVAPRPARRTAG
jgi:hypothetical protein